jgi:hypothetical protein
MNAIAKNKKWITRVVLVTFICLSYLANTPLPAAAENDPPAPLAVEKAAENEPAAIKKSTLPMILVGAGVLAVAAAIFFLFIKGGSEKLRDEFASAADKLWQPRTASAWSVAGGYYICQKAFGGAPSAWWEWSLYNRSWAKPDYTVTTRMQITDHLGPFGLLLVDDPGMEAVNGYQIMFYGDGRYSVRKVQGWNYKTSTAVSYAWIREWTSSLAILPGLNTWNTYKLVKTGSDYRVYANDTLVFSFSDLAYDPRLVALAVHTQVSAMHLEVDSFYVDVK